MIILITTTKSLPNCFPFFGIDFLLIFLLAFLFLLVVVTYFMIYSNHFFTNQYFLYVVITSRKQNSLNPFSVHNVTS